MDYCLSFNKPSVLESLPSAVKRTSIPPSLNFSGDRRINLRGRRNRITQIVVAGGGTSNCEFSSLNTPLEPKSSAGKFLTGVLLDDFKYFHVAVGKQLEQLAAARKEAAARLSLSFGSDEASLHRRIAELREQECQIAIEDVMYMLVLYKFREISVHLVPRLSRCIYNGRLEIWPSKDWELESIHSYEVLEMVKEHLTAVIGWKADSNVTASWATTKIPRFHLCQIYTASILYGYFLKSAALRHRLDLSVVEENCELGIIHHRPLTISKWLSCGLKNISFDHISTTRSTSVGQDTCDVGKKCENLRCYIMGFDSETIQMCAKPRTKETVSLTERHSCALFGDEKTGLVETNEVISTSLSSLKRMVLEAVAIGSFLWDTEEFVSSVYKLKEN